MADEKDDEASPRRNGSTDIENFPEAEPSKRTEEPWSVFSPNEKRFIVGLAAMAGFFSPVSAAIYFPALKTLSEQYHVSISEINLTVTVYMIFQGLVPSIFSDVSESLGKRPVYLITFTIYIAANIGLALQNSYGALMGLRCLQSTGSSVTASLAMSTASDVARGSERGIYLGWTMAGLLIGPTLGPVIGGLLAGTLGWRSIFWFLTICAGVFIIVYFIIGMESSRTVVGNGSIPPPKFNQSILQLIQNRRQRQTSTSKAIAPPPVKWRTPNPARSFLVFKEKDMCLILLYGSLVMGVSYQLSASTVTIFQETYGYNDTITGLCYLPLGIGSVVGSFGAGRIYDHVLRRVATRHGFDVDNGDRLSEAGLNFPWARARLYVIVPGALIGPLFLIGYGWVVEAKTTVAAPLIFQFFFSVFCMAVANGCNLMIIDSYPTKSATASAANNISRCLVGAGATALVEPMLQSLGRGWTFTLDAFILMVLVPALWPIWRYGVEWRRVRTLREIKQH